MTDWRPPSDLPDLRNVRLVALDLETNDERLRAGKGSGWPTGEGYICGVALAWRAEEGIQARYFSFRHRDSVNFDPQQFWQWLRDHITAGVHFVFMNGGYDLGWIRRESGILMPPAAQIEEIGIAAAMIDENRHRYALGALCKSYGVSGKDETLLRDAIEKLFGIPPEKQTGINSPQSFIWRLPAHLSGRYAEADACATLALFETLNPILDNEGVRKPYRLDVGLMPLTQEMRWQGIRVDLDRAERNRAFLFRRRDGFLAELSQQLGQPTDIEDVRSPGWLAETFGRLGIEYPLTPTGKPSFKAGVDGWMKNHSHPVPQLVTRAREFDNAADKFIGNFLIGHAFKDRIRAEINLHRSDNGGTRSSRLSYSDPALQQLPSKHPEITRRVRECLIAEERELWVSCDFAQQEFRLLVNAAACLGLPGALEAQARYQADPTTDFHAYVAELTNLDRTTAKTINFGIAYGAGPVRIAGTIGRTVDEAKAIIETYNRALPFVHELSKYCMNRVERYGYLRLFDGTKRRFDLWECRGVPWGKGTEPCGVEEARHRSADRSHPWFGQRLQRASAYTAMNQLIQATAARQTKKWMLDCWHAGIVPRLQMHDALEMSVSSPDPAELVARLGCGAIPTMVPMTVDIKYGRNWADAAHKQWADVPTTVDESVRDPEPIPTSFAPTLIAAPRRDDFKNLDTFINFVAERWAIYHRRQAGHPWPWTDDKILRTYSFCNMSRSLDRVTQWIWQHWLEPHRPDLDAWFACVIGRFVNRISTLAALDFPVPWAPERFIEVMRSRPQGQVFGAAYVIPAFQKDDRPKYISLVERIFTPMWEAREALRPRAGMTISAFTNGLMAYPNVGGFLAAQIAADAKMVSVLREAEDFETFALSGRGSQAGMNFLLGRGEKAKWREKNWHYRLCELHALITPIYQKRGLPIPDFQDTQNQLCEWHKFWQIKSGIKERLKREYKPAPAADDKPATKRKRKPKVVEPPASPQAVPPERAPEPRAIEPELKTTVEPAPPIAPGQTIPDYILADMARRAAAPAIEPPAESEQPDRAEAARFLALLDPTATRFTFQTFHDNQGRKNPALAKILHGTLAQHFATLNGLNSAGAGIFVTINETDLRGRTAENVVRVRCLFIDLDGAPLDPVLAAAPRVHFVTESSPGRWQAFWNVSDIALADFRTYQRALIKRFGSDASVHDLPRVMRLPGFLHRKGEPFRTRIVTVNDAPPHAVAAFVGLANVEAPTAADLVVPGLGIASEPLPPLAEVAAALEVIPIPVAGEGTIADAGAAYAHWINIGMATHAATGGSAEGLALFDKWSQKSQHYDAEGLAEKWRSFHPREVTMGTLAYHADEANPTWRDCLDAQVAAGIEQANRAASGSVARDPPQAATGAPALDPNELNEWDAGALLEGAAPSPRQWLIAGMFCRTFLSGLVAPGDAGKTTLRLTQAIELATGRELLGLRVYRRCKVLVVSFEDDRAELHRRLLAICRHHSVDPAELKGWLFCRDLNDGGKLAALDARGRHRLVGPLDGMLRRAIARTGCSLVVLDPFVKLHALNESDNPDMDFVCSLLIKMAQDCGIAIDSPAHTHKGAIQAGDADARRGASAQRDAGRLDYTLTVMTEDEAKQFGIPADMRKSFMRLDKAKANIVRAVKARWFRLVGMPLGNGTPEYPEGDEVQAVERWQPPEVWGDISAEALNAILDDLAAGLPDGRRYSSHNRAEGREAWQVVQRHCAGKPEAQCREMIRQWIKAGVLIEKDYDDPVARKERKGLFLNPEKRPHY
jgi:DNA polymerase I-like protein with 3'-5' exonuclease and polymerase domains